ncbi:MAG: hypothetical protein V4534_07550 [Myxococcota bacterium]
MNKILRLFVAATLISSNIFAAKFFNASLVPGVAIFGRTQTIDGLTIGIWSENPQHALALGIVNGSTSDSAGLSIALVNYAQNYKGVQWAFVNYSETSFMGLQSGAVNYAGKLSGVQFGVVNIAHAADKAVQIGLVNIIQNNESWFGHFPSQLAPGMVFVNWRF